MGALLTPASASSRGWRGRGLPQGGRSPRQGHPGICKQDSQSKTETVKLYRKKKLTLKTWQRFSQKYKPKNF